MRPGRASDLPELARLWRREVELGRQDAVPDESRMERMLSRFDFATRSRVVEDGRTLAGAVLVMSRPSPDGVLASVYAAGEDGIYPEVARWGVQFARAAGAAVVQTIVARGHGDRLAALGLRSVRPWWRMDRTLAAALPDARPVARYELVDARTRAGSWSDTFNRTFADHWRFVPRGEEEIIAGKAAELCLMAVTAREELPVAMALGELEEYPRDPRSQPVGLISSVGTLPEHRRRGLAGWLVAELLRRLRRAGARHASLYVDGLNPMRAYDVYRRLGFEVVYEAEVWEATQP